MPQDAFHCCRTSSTQRSYCSSLSRSLYPRPLSGSYGTLSREVLAESVLTANDPFKQFAISFFDNKFKSLIPLKIAYFLR